MKTFYTNIETEIKTIELSGDDEDDFVNEMQSKSFITNPEVTKAFRIAINDENVKILGRLGHREYKYRLIILKDRNMKVFYI